VQQQSGFHYSAHLPGQPSGRLPAEGKSLVAGHHLSNVLLNLGIIVIVPAVCQQQGRGKKGKQACDPKFNAVLFH
jgi:hypothetical protein